MRILQLLLKAVPDAAIFNPEVQVAPACILWPDRDRQWEAVIPILQVDLPELFILGDYNPDKKTGPAIWLRCVIGGNADDVSLPKEHTRIFYLPGVSRQDLRAVESCPESLKPLAELQYRGVIWSQINAKDWTILAYLKSDQGGLGLDVAQDNDTKNAMQLALDQLLKEDLELLKGKRLDKDYFNTLLTGGDPVRDLLRWIDQGDGFQANHSKNEWKAFVEVCKSLFGFNPQKEGALAGAAKLAAHEGPWRSVWERFCEAPKRYPNIPAQIRKCQMPNPDIFSINTVLDGWPQWNEHKERELQRELLTLGNTPVNEAREKLRDLENKHSHRRGLIWAELDESPLARALEHLAKLAEITTSDLAAGSVDDLASGYCSHGWKADDAVIRALAHVGNDKDLEAISAAVRSVYLPWAEESARHLQKIVYDNSYPGGTCLSAKHLPAGSGECILFVDGLRFDTGKRLTGLLERKGYNVMTEPTWAALPSVTATGKAAVTPVKDKIRGSDENADFEPAVAGTGKSLKGGYHLKKLLAEAGWSILESSDKGNGQQNAWCELGDIDHEGHDRGWKLARHLDGLLAEITDRIAALLAAGWKNVRVVTDHGWLLLPGGLPKLELPSALAETKWGRCASLKSGASTKERLYPWYWNPNQHFALADGVSCFKNGEEYTHGGLSLQECLTLQLTVSQGVSSQTSDAIEITDLVWKGLRCTVAVDGNIAGISLDIRTQAGDSSSSVVLGIKPLKEDGTASVVIEDEDMEGHDAIIVLLDANGQLVKQVATIIGGENK